MKGARDLVVALLIKAKDEASGVLSTVTGKVTALGAALLTYLTGRFFASAIDSAAEFEAQMDKVIAKTDDGAEHMEDLKQAAEEIGPRYKATATEAAQALEVLGAAGLKSNDAIKVLPATLALAKAEGMGFEQAAGLVLDAAAKMGIAYGDAGRVADLFIKGANQAKVNAAELGESMQYAGGQARAAGMSLEDTLAVLDAFAKAGFTGSQAGTMLNNILAQLKNPTSEARRELAALGITTGDLNTVIDGLNKAGPAGERAINAFGLEAGPGLRGLMAVGVAGIQEYRKGLGDVTDTATKTADSVSSNLNGALSGLAVAWDTVKRKLVEPLLEPITKQVDDLTKALQTSAKDGSLNTIREALKNAFEQGAKWIREFIAEFDFKAALKAVGDFINESVAHFEKMENVGSKTAAGVSAAWNGVTGVFYAVVAGVLKLGEYFNSTLAAIEEQTAKIGIGSKEHAEELRRTANELETKAVDMAENSAAAFGKTKAALDQLTASTTSSTAAAQQAGTAAQTTAQSYLDAASKAATAAEKVAILKQGYSDLAAANAPIAEQDKLLQALAATLTGTGEAAQQVAQGQQAVAKANREVNPELEAAQKHVNNLWDAYDKLRNSAVKDAQAIAEALLAYQQAQHQLTAKTKQDTGEVSAAYQQLGVRSSKELQELARQAVQQFEAIKKSGTASPGDIQRAFESMAGKVLEAAYAQSESAGRVAEAGLRAKATTEAQRKALDELAQKYHQTAQKADEHTEATKKTAQAQEEASKTTKKAAESEEFWANTFARSGAKIASVILDGRETFALGVEGVAAYNRAMETLKQRYEQADLAAKALSSAEIGGPEDITRLQAMIEGARHLKEEVTATSSSMNSLRNNRLEGLQSAIDSATEKLRGLAEAAREAFEATQDEWDRMNNNLDDIERRSYEKRLAQYQQMLDAARVMGDQANAALAQQAIDNLNKIHQRNLAQAEEEMRTARQRAAEEQSRQSGASNGASGARGAGQGGATQPPRSSGAGGAGQSPVMGTYRLELVMPSGRVIPATMTAADIQALVAELAAQAKRLQ